MGNLTRDPEVRTTPSGQSVASFAVATNLGSDVFAKEDLELRALFRMADLSPSS